ncbi:uncharacterized protein FFE2_15888 [Fusarium fujikuroi]
MQNAA